MAQQVSQNKIQYGVLHIGANDFSPRCYTDPLGNSYCGLFESIYNGTLSGQNLTNILNTKVNNIKTAINTVRNANPNFKLVVTAVMDQTLTPYAASRYTNATGLQRVKTATEYVNREVKNYTTSLNIPFFDVNAFGASIIGRLQNGAITICGERITFSAGNEPHNFILGDNDHGGTISNGLIANEYIKILNQHYNTNIAEFTERELIVNAGITPSTTCAASFPRQGDGNNDGLVNGVDYVIWLNHYDTNSTGPSNGDFNNNGKVDGFDYVIWLTNSDN